MELPPLEPDRVQIGRDLIMHQDSYWWDVRGRRWPLDLMDFDYLRNVLRFLEEMAPQLYEIERVRVLLDDGIVLEDQDPLTWVRSTRLHRAIKGRITEWPRIEVGGR